MKATARILSGWMALVVCLSASRVTAGAMGGGVAALVGAARVTQTEVTIASRTTGGNKRPICCGGRVRRCGRTTWQPPTC